MDSTQSSGIAEAVSAVGSQEALAKIVGCTQQNISAWVTQGFVPVEHILAVEQATGVPRERLVKPKLLELLRPETFEG